LMPKKKTRGIIFWLLILFLLAAAAGGLGSRNFRQGRYRDWVSAVYVMAVVKFQYYQPVSLPKLVKAYWERGTIAGMLRTLKDPYTRYLGKHEFAELRKETSGTFGGIGVYLIPKDEELLVSAVVSGSPGERAGLQQGDRIVAIGKKPVKNLGTEVAIAKIRGPAGTKVKLRITRGEGKSLRELDLLITRKNIYIPTVEMQVKKDPELGEYAYLKISQFAETTPADLSQKIHELKKSRSKAILLDLRSNPGGALDAAIKVAGEFLPQGTPIIHIFRRGYPVDTLAAPKMENVCENLPMAVLVNSWSASAAEIVSGALKDQKRASLVGTHTFGKDLIQEVKELPNGTGVTITIANYLTSGKVNIHKRGVQPHRVVEIPGAMERLLKKGDPRPFFRMEALQEREAVRMLREMVVTGNKIAG